MNARHQGGKRDGLDWNLYTFCDKMKESKDKRDQV